MSLAVFPSKCIIKKSKKNKGVQTMNQATKTAATLALILVLFVIGAACLIVVL